MQALGVLAALTAAQIWAFEESSFLLQMPMSSEEIKTDPAPCTTHSVTCDLPALPADWVWSPLPSSSTLTGQTSAWAMCKEGFQSAEVFNESQRFQVTCTPDGALPPIHPCTPITCDLPALPADWVWVDETQILTTQQSALATCNDELFEVTCTGGVASTPEQPCLLLQSGLLTLSGQVKSATHKHSDPLFIRGATLFIDDKEIQTNDKGEYSVQLEAALHTYTLTAIGYTNVTGSVEVAANTRRDMYMSPMMQDDSWRFVVEWEEYSTDWHDSAAIDLDAYMISDECKRRVYVRDREETCNGVTVHLDVDDRTGGFPETMTLSNLSQCTSSCLWVFKVSNQGRWEEEGGSKWDPSPEEEAASWQGTKAFVNVYNGDSLFQTVSVSSDYGFRGYDHSWSWQRPVLYHNWYLFTIDEQGTIVECGQDCESIANSAQN